MSSNSLFYGFLCDVCGNQKTADDIYYIKHMVECHNANVVPLVETTLNRVFDKHAKEGYFIISASRGSNTPSQNKELTNQLEADLKAYGKYSYLPISGGFIENRGQPNEQDVTEDSFLVMGRTPRTTPEEQAQFIQEMIRDAIDLCKKYGQDSVLVQVPGEPAKYITKDGTVDMEFNGPNKYNDLTQDYFSRLHRGKNLKPSDSGSHGRWSMTAESVEMPRFSLTTHGLSESMNTNHVRHLQGDLSEAVARGEYRPIVENNLGKKIMGGVYHGDRHMNYAILTAENPNCQSLPRAENRLRNQQLEDILRSGHYLFSKVTGSYGVSTHDSNKEHSYVIGGITVDAAKALSAKYGQQSFIYCDRSGETPEYQMWAIDRSKGQYVIVDTKTSMNYVPENDDFYTNSGDFKINIPFEKFSVDEPSDDTVSLNNEQLIKDAENIVDTKLDTMTESQMSHFKKSLNESITGHARYNERIMAGL